MRTLDPGSIYVITDIGDKGLLADVLSVFRRDEGVFGQIYSPKASVVHHLVVRGRDTGSARLYCGHEMRPAPETIIYGEDIRSLWMTAAEFLSAFYCGINDDD